jgi:hypothetical protein
MKFQVSGVPLVAAFVSLGMLRNVSSREPPERFGASSPPSLPPFLNWIATGRDPRPHGIGSHPGSFQADRWIFANRCPRLLTCGVSEPE